MPPFKNPLEALKPKPTTGRPLSERQVQNALAHAAAIRKQLASDTRLADPGPSELVTDLFPGDDVLATPTPQRHTPEPADAVAGRRGVGVSQHLTVVDPEPMGQRIPIGYCRTLKARRQDRLTSLPRPTGGSAA
jgi:hypothetical protein